MEQLSFIRKALDIATFVLFCLAMFAIGFLFAPDLRPAPVPAPAPYISPNCDPSTPRPYRFDVVCPHCRRRFTVDTSLGSTGAKPPGEVRK